MSNDTASTRLMRLIAVLAVGLAVAIVTGGRALSGVQFQPFGLTQFTTSLAPLLVVALLIERVIEVFFGVWREPGDRVVEQEAAVAEARAMGGVASVAEAAAAQTAVAIRKGENTRIAFLCGGTLGIIASLAGVRALVLLVDAQKSWGAVGPSRWWTLLDVLLTAGLLGGGADGFHHTTAALSAFLKATQKKAEVGAATIQLNQGLLRPVAVPVAPAATAGNAPVPNDGLTAATYRAQ
jgi:hypothetical protein